MAFNSLPEFELGRQLDGRSEGSATTPPGISEAPIRRGCITALLALIALGVAAAVALVIIAVVYFIRSQPPNLPGFARPAGAHEFLNKSVPCDDTQDIFGPSYRQLAFESDRTWPDLRDEITQVFASRGWTRRVWTDEAFWEDAPTGNRRIFYATGREAKAYLARYHTTPHLSTIVAVYVSDCPGP